MQWRGRRQSSNIEDRRGGGVKKVGGVSIIGLIIAFVLWQVFGISPETTMGVTQQIQTQTQSSAPATETADMAESREFVATVLADTEDVWTPIFAQAGQRYQPPSLVLFSGAVQSACGSATSASGPFYCPADQKVYLDTQFFRDMRTQMNIGGEQNSTELTRTDLASDFAQAYVIAHEVGHHVQTLLGISARVQAARKRGERVTGHNGLLVRQELQADCLAGVWAHHAQQRHAWLEPGDLKDALNAAQAIGDDRLQKQAQGHVVPDSVTHGTSAQRERWFSQGYKSGSVSQCDTFSAQQL